MTSQFLAWSDDDYAAYGRQPHVAGHRLHLDPAFEPAALIDLLDWFPRRELQIYTMGDDPARPDGWHCVDAGDADGAELWQAVAQGRLWLNLLWAERYEPYFATLLERMYGDLLQNVPRLQGYSDPHLTLLISSPRARVQYHFDAEDNMLWHLHGEKIFWVYPRELLNRAPPAAIEDVFARARDEELPYDPDFDASARAMHLRPGDVASWPYNSPHRIDNGDSVNVSLSTSVETMESRRRALTMAANRLLRQRVGWHRLSSRDRGLAPAGKRFMYRAARRLGAVPQSRPPEYIAGFRVDGHAPSGMRRLDHPVRASFSRDA